MAGREQSKQLHEKHQAILSKLLKDDDNKYCVDCDAKGKSVTILSMTQFQPYGTTHFKFKY